MRLRLALIGAISLLGQAVVLREVAVAFYGNELIYALALGGWLLGSAAGAAYGPRRQAPSDESVRGLLAAFAVTLIAAVALARGTRILLGGMPGAYLPFGRQMLGLACCVLPPSVVAGSLFQRAAKISALRGGSFAAAYAWESAGSLAGGAAASLLLAAGVRNLAAGVLCAIAAVAAAGVPARRREGWSIASATVALVLLGALAKSTALDRWMTAWNHPSLVETRDTPYGRLTITEESGQTAVYQNDALAYESEGTDAEELVHVAAVQRERPKTVLVLGGALPGLLPEALLHDPDSVVDLELDRDVLDVVAAVAPSSVRGALTDPRVRVAVGDPRLLLERSGPADLILVAMPEPNSGGANRFYTREFFDACARRLTPGGVLAFRLRGADNVWTPLAMRRAASIVAALRETFADVVIVPGAALVFLASSSPLDRDPGILAGRLSSRGPGPRLVTPAYLRYLYTNDRFAETALLLARSRVPVNSDGRPVCYAATLLYELARFFPQLVPADLAAWEPRRLARSAWPWLALAGAAVLLMLGRRRDASRRALLAGLAGGSGMLLECALLLGYQTRSGVLYRDLGLLMTAFMAGLALGAAAVDRAGSSTARSALSVAAFAATALGSAAWLQAGSPGGLLASSALLLAVGFLVAAVVAHASRLRDPDQARVVAPVYAADLAGGCAGSLVAGVVLIPILGLPGTALAAAVTIAGAFFL